MLDTTHEVETPEGVSIHLRLAGAPTRGLAWLTDWFIRFVCYWGIYIPLSFFGEFGVGMILIILFLGEWFYPVFFEVKQKGQTPGKKMMNIQVMNEDGTPVGWHQSILRNLLRFVDILPGIGLLGMIVMLCNKQCKRFGDMAAGTLVVYKEKDTLNIYANTSSKPLPPAVPLNLEEQAAVVAFAERASKLSYEREQELAALVEELTGQTGKKAVKILRGNAAYLVGRRT